MALRKTPAKGIACRHCFSWTYLKSFEPKPTKIKTAIAKYECRCGSVTTRSYPRGRPGKVTVDDIRSVVRECGYIRLKFGNCYRCDDPLEFMMDNEKVGIITGCSCGYEVRGGLDLRPWQDVADYFNRLPADDRKKRWDEFQALVNIDWPSPTP